MIVVSDTSPLNYLVLIGADHVLPVLFGQVIAPSVVLIEMQHSKAPLKVQSWAMNPPDWLEVRSPTSVSKIGALGPGKLAAIALAQELKADAILIDERDGTAAAERLGIAVIGTLAILGLGAEQNLLSLPTAIAELRRTTFRGPKQLIDDLLRLDQSRRSKGASAENEPPST
jgi:predicted nucleic acid-binding protein